MTTRLYIRTFGCQMNEYDSAKMADVLAQSQAGGVEATDDPAKADIILFNTCSVREKAQEKVFSDLGRLRALKRVGDPYSEEEIAGAAAAVDGKTELDAVVAYLQALGKNGPKGG